MASQTAAVLAPLGLPADSEPLTEERVARIGYLVGNAYGLAPGKLRGPSSSAREQAARSLAIAIARSLLLADLSLLARAFGLSGAEEAAAHCNAVARRAAADRRFATVAALISRTCAQVLRLEN